MEGIGKSIAAEFIATFALVFIGAGAVVMASPSGIGGVGTALAFGLVLATMMAVTTHISGGLVNPAVAVAMWVTGKLATPRAAAYVVAELAGAIAGAAVLRFVLPEDLWKAASLGAPLLGPGIGTGRGIVIEAVLTFFLVFAFFGTLVDERARSTTVAPFAVGLVLTFDILVGGALTGAAMNPARALGPELVSGTWTSWWVYWIGPISGAVIAGVLYWALFLKDSEPATP